jgi:hypothetical protein
MNLRDLAEQHSRQADLRDSRTCQDLFCEQYTVEAEIFMCMFYLWAEEYGPGWWEDIGEEAQEDEEA